ncbi:unnamed protein product [Rotaria sp. Silwood2]|nr:unnamed protein product [Rotaria sp. Silwood2]CAF3040690.1 unnamed protein product [Rotaria sp. Silwood2]CAF3186063.1 unnamed protein product [Rotaria sp. Silwood2]CAF3929511.1 unnamed protein product [Rotaria sp. Silwood2]CAF4185746.1 unnamed protein product [Rotaria sp. Silwood2]
MQIRTYTMSGPVKIIKTKLFIGNLDPATQPNELSELFSSFGTVLEASVIKDYGFVHYGSVEEAEKAAVALNNKEFHGKRLRVELSTSTVRHRPGQPEPASALRHSRARAATKGNSNGIPRYSSGASVGGVGPMRHNSSAWVRNDIRPYDSISVDHGVYDRSRPYTVRSDSRRYYEDGRDNGYSTGYDAPSYGSSVASGQTEAPHYREIPSHVRVEGYGPSRPYDRHLSAPAVDPYYGTAVPQGAPPAGDPYHNYDPYEKYYASRPRDPEFPGQRDYNLYSNYRNDPYATANSQGSIRHDLPVGLQQQPPGVYPTSHRQPQSYPSGSYNVAQYYGAQQR